jgi:hypothetical protein
MALAGEMLGAGGNATLLHGGNPGCSHGVDQIPIRAIRADAYVGTVRICKDIENRTQVDVYSQAAEFFGFDRSLLAGIFHLASFF